MFNTFKKLLNAKSSVKRHYEVDIHSHLIPGIDDGSSSMQESIELIKGLQRLGFTKLITTPHIMKHRFPNTSAVILSGLDALNAELKNEGVEIEVKAASEYYLDEHFMELLKQKDILTFGDNYLLFEMSYALKPVNLDAAIFEMKVAGYRPVLAHPERYMFMHHDFSIYESLKEQGVLFQINLNSLGGYYSKPVQKVAHKLVERGWIDFIGSDTHKAKHLEHLSKNLNSKIVEKIFQKNRILNDTLF